MKVSLLKPIFIISPKDSAQIRSVKYYAAFFWKILTGLYRRLIFSNVQAYEALSNAEDFETLFHKKTTKITNANTSKPKIILLGPYHFKQPMWSIRASNALPDLITPLSEFAEVHLVTPIPSSNAIMSLNDLVKEHGITHHLLPANFNLMSLGEKNKTLDDLIERIQPYVVMNSFGVIASGFDAVTCARRNNIKSVLRVPGNETNARKKMTSQQVEDFSNETDQEEFFETKIRFAITNADNVMVMSKDEASRIVKARKSKEGVFLQIRGVDTEVYRPNYDEKKNENKILNVGFIGRLTLEKGTDILLETMDKLSANSNIIFHIASPEYLQKDIERKNKNLVWHGYVPHKNMPSLMEELDVLILPSHMEGRSQTMMEAMSSGLPVLLQSKIHPECLPGMVHCDEEAKSFVDALNTLSMDSSKLKKLSADARTSALHYFDKKVWAIKMSDAFKQLLKRA